MSRKIYKSEDAKTIYEYLKEFDEETEKRKRFSNALKRELLKGINAEIELKNLKSKKLDESWDSIEK